MSITGTLIVQMIVFLILVGFTMKFVWPPLASALDERARKIADGLAAIGALPGGHTQAEQAGDAAQARMFGHVQRRIGARDAEQGGQHAFQHVGPINERDAQLGRVRLITLRAVACFIEQAADIAGGVVRDAETAAEHVDLGAVHRAVAFGQLGRQHHHRDRE